MIQNVKWLFLLFFLGGTVLLNAQKKPAENWFHLDGKADGIWGVSTEKLYNEVIKDRMGSKVIVAVIDGGTDIEHEDLRNVIWVNKDEVPGNGIDDDNNGFIDDVHGWNFIGGAKGEHLVYEQVEELRLYKEYDKRFKDVDEGTLSKNERALYEQYISFSEEIEEKKAEASENIFLYRTISKSADRIENTVGKDDISINELKTYDFKNPLLSQVALMLVEVMNQEGFTFKELKDNLSEAVEHFEKSLEYYYNPEFAPRSIVGDNPADFSQKVYGNNDVEGPRGEHGTHVAGIIGAERGNGIGLDGVANNVELMILRVVPDGDERDKDIALAIRYAVDNGAQVINMSFGKGVSPYKTMVDDAVKYAAKKDVLLVHAAGNDNSEIFADNNFPNDLFLKKGLFGPKYADNWIEIGASSWKTGEDLSAVFSNYSAENVDVFAPGVAIYSTVPDDKYKNNDGTSMASPVVAGVAALLRSYFPDLSAEQVKGILMSSASIQNYKVKIPGGTDMVPFKRLSITGGITNAYNAFQMAQSVKGKNRKRASERAKIWEGI